MSELLQGCSGYVPVRNGLRLDYCFELACASLLPVCEEVIISVGLTEKEEAEGDDGTLARAHELAARNAKIRVVTDRWVDAVNDPTMLRRWLNRIREQCRYNSQLTLDADEVLDPCSHDFIRRCVGAHKCAWAYRVNLWRDPLHIAPHDTCCGQYVARLGPTSYIMPSDGPEVPELPIREEALRDPAFIVWHLGFLRKPEAFFAKSKVMQWHLINSYDSRLTRAEEEKVDNWWELCHWYNADGSVRELPAHGLTVPDQIKPWLRERGHSIE